MEPPSDSTRRLVELLQQKVEPVGPNRCYFPGAQSHTASPDLCAVRPDPAPFSPAYFPELRPLTIAEIEKLEHALGKPVERQYLVHWISQTTAQVTKAALLPMPAEGRDELVRLAGGGRRWLNQVRGSKAQDLFSRDTDLPALRSTVENFCATLEVLSKRLGNAARHGHPQSNYLLKGFLKTVIGIAKAAKVLPSTPSRAPRKPGTSRPAPAFFNFARTAVNTAKAIIKSSSSLSEGQKRKAIKAFWVQSDAALSKMLEEIRGRIGDYRETTYGLVGTDWTVE